MPMSSYLTTCRSRVSVTMYLHASGNKLRLVLPRLPLSRDRTTTSIPRATIDLPPSGPAVKIGPQSDLAIRVVQSPTSPYE